MAEPLIVLVLLLSTSADADPTWSAMAAAARKALGTNAVLLVEEPTVPPSDAEAQSLGERVHASAVVELRWQDADRNRALIHLHLAGAPQWIDREITFDVTDASSERGRALGFACSAMISDTEQLVEPSSGQQPKVVHPENASQPSNQPPVPPAPSKRWRAAAEGAASASAGLGGDAGGFGGFIGLRWYLSPQLALRLGGGFRAGDVPSAQAQSLVAYGAVGAAWRLLSTSGSRPFEFGLRADLLTMRQELARSSAGTSLRLGRWMNGADLALEGAWFWVPSLAAVGAVGTEAAFGPTDVFVGAEHVARIPVLRGIAELGLLVRL